MTYRLFRHAVALLVVAGVVLGPGIVAAGEGSAAAEQWLLYDTNRARWDPFGFAAENNMNSSGWVMAALPPLAYNTQLDAATAYKAAQVVGNPSGFETDPSHPYYHCFWIGGGGSGWDCPNELAIRYGYPLEWDWPGILEANMIEIYWASTGAGGSGPPIGAEVFMSSFYHRQILFEWGDREDMGIGWYHNCSPQPSVNCNYLFAHVASRDPYATFITGFVYNDSNPNGIMDFGEGKSGVTVTAQPGGYSAVTGAGGAYSIPVPDDRGYTVTASGNNFLPTASARACVTGSNLGVDFRDLGSSSNAVVHGYPGRIDGANRYETAASIARCSHPNPFPNGQGVVYIGVGTNYPDALAAAPAAAAENAPILLTDPYNLPPSTQVELDRLHPETIVILGGPAAIADSVVDTLQNRYPGSNVVRRYGPNRYSTAVAISAAAFPGTVNTVYVTTGENFPDALMAGPPAAADGAALLLTRQDSLPAEVAAEIARLDPSQIILIGTTSAVSNLVFAELGDLASVTRIANNDKFTQSALVSATLLPAANVAYIATGNNFPDALAAGPLAAIMEGSILLVGSTLPSSVAAELERLNPTSITVFGGSAAVPDGVVAAARSYLEWN